MATEQTFEIKLPLFEGPFDLLLFFIERDELDIYDIPISKITEDFLHYLEHLEKLNVEVASEFILVAATLMRIKAKMLLPRPVIDEEGNEIDPREELVKHLLEYKKYKSVVATLAKMEADRLDREKRGNLKKEIKKLSETINVEAEMQDLDLYKMMKVFQKVMKRYEFEQNKPVHQVIQYPYTIEKQKAKLMERLVYGKKLSFVDMIQEKPDKILVIYNFLSILELLQLKQIVISLGEGFNNFWIERRDETTMVDAK
ncbi:MAG: segregation/condensation protein A [Ekhidna sp.]|uniref:segregation and condensation protein A n=1 Tax=Ekhidna sp. TaxID=2608089 RepID=UPI0032ECF750